MLRWSGRKRELNCQQVEAQLMAYLKDGLSPARRQAVRAHLATCDACARAVREAEALEAELVAKAVRHRPTLSPQASACIQEWVYRRMRRGLIVQRAKHVTERVVVVVAVLVLAVGAFALWQWMRPQIAGTGDQGETVVIIFACRDYQRDRYHDLAQEFHKTHPTITVQLVSVDEVTAQEPGVVSTDDVYKVAAAADTFLDSSYILGWAAPQNIVLDLTDLAEQDINFTLDDFYPGPLTLFQSGGKLWGLPSEVNLLLIFYNPELFDAAGVPYPQIGWSWDDFLEAASRLTIREEEAVKQYGFMDPWPYYSLPLLAHQKAGKLVDWNQDPPVARLDAPGVVEAVQWYTGLILVHGVMPNPVTMDSATWQLFPHQQSPAMWVDFSYDKDNFPKAGVVSLPEAGEAAGEVWAYGYFVSAGTTHPEAAWRWVEFLSRQPPGRYASGIPARKSVAEETRYWKKLGDEAAVVYQYALEHAVDYSEVRGVLINAWKEVLEGEPVDAALAAAQERANQQLAQAAIEAQRPAEKVAVATPAPTPTPGGVLIRFLASPRDMEPYRALVKPFQEAHPDIAVEVVSKDDAYLYPGLAAAGDCFVGSAYLPEEHQDVSALLSLDPLIAGDEAFDLNVFVPAFLERVQADGTLWGLPLGTDVWFLYYNRDLFDAASVPYPTTDWTPEQFIEQAMALTSIDDTEPIYGFSLQSGAYSYAPYYVAWLGGQLSNADGYPTFDDPTVVEAVTCYVDLIAKTSPPSATDRSQSRWFWYTGVGAHPASVTEGRAAMWSESHYNHYGAHRFGAPPLDFEVGVVPLPVGAAPLNRFWTRALFISAQTPHPDACWDWIAFLSAQWKDVSMLPVRYDVVTSEDWRNQVGEATADAWLAILNRVETTRHPWSDSLSNALFWLDEALVDVFAGARPSAALAEAQDKAAIFTDCMAGSEITEEAIIACAHQADPSVEWPFE